MIRATALQPRFHVQPHPNEVAEKLTGRPYLSYSAISTYAACPLRVFLQIREDLPEAFVSASLIFGSAMHRAIEKHFQELLAGAGPPPIDDLLQAYHDGWSENEIEEVVFNKNDDMQTLEDLAKRMLTAFQASDLARPAGRILAIEEQLAGELVPGCPDLLARLDLVVDTGDALVITDFKTSRSPWSQNQVQDSSRAAPAVSRNGQAARGRPPGTARLHGDHEGEKTGRGAAPGAGEPVEDRPHETHLRADLERDPRRAFLSRTVAPAVPVVPVPWSVPQLVRQVTLARLRSGSEINPHALAQCAQKGGIPMPDLRDGESVEMQGSGSKPYVLKNVGGLYSCSCPAWRNQSLPIDRRTCKHLRNLRGDEAEAAADRGHAAGAPWNSQSGRKFTGGPTAAPGRYVGWHE